MSEQSSSLLRILSTQAPSDHDLSVSHLKTLFPDLSSLFAQLPNRHEIATYPDSGKHYIVCPFPRQSHSPLTRNLEILCGELLQLYAALYLGSNAVSSAYFWTAGQEIHGLFLLSSASADSGLVESTHFIKILTSTGVSVYSSLRLHTEFPLHRAGEQARGRFEAQKEKVTIGKEVSAEMGQEALVRTIGEMVEEHENCLRRAIEALHLAKCVEALEVAFEGKKSTSSGLQQHPIFATLKRDEY